MYSFPLCAITILNAQVYAATFKGQPVAVKDLITTMGRSTDDMLARFECIIAEVKSLKKCNHPNLVHCLGVVANTWPLKLLYELCEGGDLHKQLSSESAAQWQWANKCVCGFLKCIAHLLLSCRGRFVALDIAKGMKYLNEELKMVHLDIKSSNGTWSPLSLLQCAPSAEHSAADRRRPCQGW